MKITQIYKNFIPEANSSRIFIYDPPNRTLEPPLQDKNILALVKSQNYVIISFSFLFQFLFYPVIYLFVFRAM